MKKNNNNIKFLNWSKLFVDATMKNGLVSLGNSIELPALFRRLGWRLVLTCFPRRVKVPARMHQLSWFAKYVLKMVKNHGQAYTVNYLKASQLAVQKAIAKDRISSMRALQPGLPLPRLATSGLPRIIPLRDRRAILNGNSSTIRWWLTIFSVYRVISIEGQLKLNTITDSFSGSVQFLERVDSFLKTFSLSERSRFSWNKRSIKLLLLESASPSSKSSWIGFVKDANTLQSIPLLANAIHVLLEEFKAKPEQKLWNACVKVAGRLRPIGSYKETDSTTTLGQLSIKEEAAGKVRVFALVDVWTQSVLKPIHDMCFDFLAQLPNDGTFDQQASVLRANQKAIVANKSYGYDLSAATDRLPASLQRTILSVILNERLGCAWYDLLVGREYILSHEKYGKHRVRYSVGQPMGALSSWAMLAITHHFLVQYAATLAGLKRAGEWYSNYELLGDDIILFDSEVARQYLLIMDGIGVPINVSKSVVAKNATIEFAKVTFHKGQNVSAISWKMFLSQMTNMGRSNIAFSLLKKRIVTTNVIKWVQNIVRHTRSKLGQIQYNLFAILNMFVNSRLLSLDNLLLAAIPHGEEGRKAGEAYEHLLKSLSLDKLRGLLASAVRGEEVKVSEDRLSSVSWMMYQMSFEQLLSHRIKTFVDKFDVNGSAIRWSKGIMSHLFCSSHTYKGDPAIIAFHPEGRKGLNGVVLMRLETPSGVGLTDWGNLKDLPAEISLTPLERRIRSGFENLMYMGFDTEGTMVNVIHNYLYRLKRAELLNLYDRLNKMIYMNLPSSRIKFLSGNDYEVPVRATINTMLVLRERPLSDWVDANQVIDDIRTGLELLKRAIVKTIEGGSPEIKESPLHSLDFLSKAVKRANRVSETGAVRLSRRLRRARLAKKQVPVISKEMNITEKPKKREPQDPFKSGPQGFGLMGSFKPKFSF